jgi:hypothetical protein
LLENNQDKISWDIIMYNTNFIKILKGDYSRIIFNEDFWKFCNFSPHLQDETAFDLIKFYILSTKYKKNDEFLYKNRGIFTYDFDKIRQINAKINKEILEESAKRLYKPSLFLNPNSSDLEKEIQGYINIYE